jgi:xanthine dehydrogenase YagT iron-sulfur-binding subunit
MTDIAHPEYVYELSLQVNGAPHTLAIDTRTTLLDLLRDRIGLTGTKKGCDHGQCGACTVLLDGRRVNACLILAATVQARSVTTIEGIAEGAELHPVQAAFVAADAYQCGYCTPGQICSAVGLLGEVADGWPSAVTPDLGAAAEDLDAAAENPAGARGLDDAEIRERMSGNLCRCGAYVNIVAAIGSVGGTA